jgi:hypothetical protein
LIMDINLDNLWRVAYAKVCCLNRAVTRMQTTEDP